MAIDRLSLITAPIEVLSVEGKVVGQATGFFYEVDGEKAYFVTNWHVVNNSSR